MTTSTHRMRMVVLAALITLVGTAARVLAEDNAEHQTLRPRNPRDQPRSAEELEARAQAESNSKAPNVLTPQPSAVSAAQAKAQRARRVEAREEALLRKQGLSAEALAEAMAAVSEAMRAREMAFALLVDGTTIQDLVAQAEAGDRVLKALLIKAHPLRVARELMQIMGEQRYAQYKKDRRAQFDGDLGDP